MTLSGALVAPPFLRAGQCGWSGCYRKAAQRPARGDHSGFPSMPSGCQDSYLWQNFKPTPGLPASPTLARTPRPGFRHLGK